MITKINIWKIVPKHIILDKIRYFRQEITNQLEMPIYDTARLDCVLDSSKISLINKSKTPLKPFTRIIIDITDVTNGEETVETLYRLVDNDTVSNVVRGNKALYRHEIDLVEATKLTERHIVDNLTFTNYLPKNYATLERNVEYIESEPIMTEHIYDDKHWVEEIIIESSTSTTLPAPKRTGWFWFVFDLFTGEGLWGAIKNQVVGEWNEIKEGLHATANLIEHITITGFFPQYVTTKGYTADSARFIGPFALLEADSESPTGYSKTIDTNIRLNVQGTYAGSITDNIVGVTENCSLSLASFTVKQPDGTTVDLSTSGKFTYRQEGVHIFTQVYEYWVKGDLDILFFEPAFRMTYTWEIRAVKDETTMPRKYNMEEVLDRVLSVYETRREGLDSQRFVLDDGLRPYLRSIQAPEFSLSQGTLFEALQQIGQYFHAIPRLKPRIIKNQRELFVFKNKDGEEKLAMQHIDDDWSDWSVITFDFLGYGKNQQYIGGNYSLIDVENPAEEYATDFLSNVENATATNYDGLITMTEPFEDGFLSTRTESSNFEISDNECIIRTRLPIRSIVKVEAKYGSQASQDITAFVVESAIYNLKKEYNITLGTDAKWLHLYYTEGQPNIKGLSLVKPTQTDIENFGNKEAIKNLMGLDGSVKLRDVIVRVTYIPFVNFKAKQYKTLIKQNEEKSTLFFNQQAHEVDVDAYGKNMNATLLKTGNIKLSKTQYFNSLNQVPKMGQWHASGYFAFIVNREINFNTPLKVSTAWSRHYNEMYSNVAIKSNYRQYEISEKESTNRNLYLPEFCVVDLNLDIEHFYESEDYSYYQDYVENNLASVGFGDGAISQIAQKLAYTKYYGSSSSGGSSGGGNPVPLPSPILPGVGGGGSGVVPFSTEEYNEPMQTYSTREQAVGFRKICVAGCKVEAICAEATSENYGKKEESNFIVPVACFPFGNSIVAYFSLDDNYSAGTSSEGATSSYNEEQYIRYGNYFGRFDKMSIFYTNKFVSNADDTTFAKLLYKWSSCSFDSDGPIAQFDNCVVSKDSRECISVTTQLNFVTPNKSITIGPALSATMPLVGDFTTKYKYIIFAQKQNALADKMEGNGILLNMPRIGYTTKTKHICISENAANNRWGVGTGGNTGGIGGFVYSSSSGEDNEDNSTTPYSLRSGSDNSLGEKVGEGYGIITEDGRICIYVEGTVYANSLLPPIYLMFRRKI